MGHLSIEILVDEECCMLASCLGVEKKGSVSKIANFGLSDGLFQQEFS